MAIDKDKILRQLQEMAQNAKASEWPVFLNDERLEDAFKEPLADENGECEPLPTIWDDYGYGQDDDGVLFITSKSASIRSNLYSKYLDEKALVWDSSKERLLLYIPDLEEPRMAFKGSCWQFAKRLKPEYEEYITLRDVYYEIMEKETIIDTRTDKEKQLDSNWQNNQK